MDLTIPFETPSTRGPGERGLVRDALKELRNGNGDVTRAIRALYDYKSTDLRGGEWRLPWTGTRTKTQLSDEDEPRVVGVTSCLLLSRLVQPAFTEKDYKRANSYISQAYKALSQQGTSTQQDLSLETINMLKAVLLGLAHELLVVKELETRSGSVAKAAAALFARIAMYAQERFSTALLHAPKPLRGWVQEHRNYCLALCHLMAGYEQAAMDQQGSAIAHFKLAKSTQILLLQKRASLALGEAESANRLVSFQPVPKSTTLPAGRCVVNFGENYF